MSLSFDRWVGKVAVVTGASSGIGAAIAEFLVDKGVIVVGLARRVEMVQERAAQLSDKPGKLYPIKCDVSNEEDVLNAFKWIEENLGHVHILINNAGVLKLDTLWNGSTENWKAVIDVNILGLCMATREAVKIMKEHDIHGHIIHLNSISGHYIPTVPQLNVYGGTKHAVTGLTTTLRKEMIEIGCRIKITSVSPGSVVSEMTTESRTFSEEQLQYLNSIPILKAKDIAEAIGYILSTPEHVSINELTITPVGEVI